MQLNEIHRMRIELAKPNHLRNNDKMKSSKVTTSKGQGPLTPPHGPARTAGSTARTNEGSNWTAKDTFPGTFPIRTEASRAQRFILAGGAQSIWIQHLLRKNIIRTQSVTNLRKVIFLSAERLHDAIPLAEIFVRILHRSFRLCIGRHRLLRRWRRR